MFVSVLSFIKAQDIMSLTIDIVGELVKLRTMEEKLKAMENEIKELRRENAEQATALEVLRGSTSEMKVRVNKLDKKDFKVAFSAFLVDSTTSSSLGPFDTLKTLVYKYVFTNIGGAYDQNTGIFTAPLKGVYVFRVFSKANGSAVTAGLFKNNQHICSTHADQGSGFYSTSNGVTLQLEKGDTLDVRLYPSARIYDNSVHHHSSFSGHLLFPL
ncbi:complement C1q-like protein 4 isoform X1 [Colossoma macropomum]|uniref:complement C1q-like protein 4 isoform X1 n=2 Tax=Colossoma macropomum TaxID=42526 RepID=UPI0018640A74|nr:complement C1q-like protein 4 isoform X1 [Colossoma macropomum]